MRLLLSVLVAGFFLYSLLPAQSMHEETGKIDVFFCPETDCMSLFSKTISNAKESLHCALYDFSDSLFPFFDKKNIDKKIVSDEKNGQPYVRQMKKSALSHNKFCIVDGRTVWTGSFNPTGNRNRNDVLLIASQVLAQNYEAEFQELWAGKKSKTPHPTISFSNGTLENYFCPEDECEDHVLEAVAQAQHSIYILAYSFTYKPLATLLAAKKEEGIDVRIVLEAREIGKSSAFSFLREHIPVKVSNENGLLHYKIIIIDNATVVTGSANPTKNGYNHNDENIVIVRQHETAQKYAEHFMKEWKKEGTLLRPKSIKQPD